MMNKTNHATMGLCAVLVAAALLAGCGSITKSAINGDIDGVRNRLAKGDSANLVDRWGWTPLMWCAYYNYYDVGKYLLEHGANVNARTQDSYRRTIDRNSTALIIASYYGHDGIVRLLLNYGADKSLENDRGMTAMDIAAQYNMTAVLDLLGSAPVRKAKPLPDEPADDASATQTILLTDGSKIVGKIISQTRTMVTVRTKYTTMTIEKSKISEMKYK